MAQVSITTSDLLQVSAQLKSWSQTMSSIITDMKNRVNNIKDWNDARAEQFREQATATAQQLALHVDNFNKMALFLQKYANMQEEAERAQKNRMQNIN